MNKDFKLFANSQGIPTTTLESYVKHLELTSKTEAPNIINMTPNIIEERQMNVAVMDVFSRLMKDRTIFFGSGVNDQVANVIVAQLLYLENTGEEDVNMYVNSPGGGVYAGLGIVDTMNYIKPDVSTTVVGMAASMGAVIQCSGAKGKRSALKHSRVMIHQPLGGAQGQASDMQINLEQILMLKKELYEIIATNSGQTFEKVEKDSDRDYWMTSKEAKEYGMIDHIVEKED